MTARGAAIERTVVVIDDDGSIAVACIAQCDCHQCSLDKLPSFQSYCRQHDPAEGVLFVSVDVP